MDGGWLYGKSQAEQELLLAKILCRTYIDLQLDLKDQMHKLHVFDM